jgi:hypothetical protein
MGLLASSIGYMRRQSVSSGIFGRSKYDRDFDPGNRPRLATPLAKGLNRRRIE